MRLGLLAIQSIIGEKALALNDDLVYHLLFSAIDFLDRSGCVPSAIAMPRARTITGTQQMDGRTAIGTRPHVCDESTDFRRFHTPTRGPRRPRGRATTIERVERARW